MKKPTPSALEADEARLTTDETAQAAYNEPVSPLCLAGGDAGAGVQSDAAQESVRPSPAKGRNAPQDPELHRLRRLLFPHELEMLDKLRPLLNNKRAEAEHLSSIIAEAM
ncbi:MAG: hypothetical protein LBD82_05830, partial [Deltaproteobacteria bacterium]|nr:hypothetical protein [Deltaproteobacteria bacterium]